MTMYVVGFGIVCVVCFGWVFYMMTCRTEDWLRLVKDERERKAEQHKRDMEKRAQWGTIIKAGTDALGGIMKKK